MKLTWKQTSVLLAALACLTLPAQAQKGKGVVQAVESAVTRKLPGKPPKLSGTAATARVKVPRVPTVPVTPTVSPITHQLPPSVSTVPIGKLTAPTRLPQVIPQFESFIGYSGLKNMIGLREAIEEFADANNRSAYQDLIDINKTFAQADSHWFRYNYEGNNFVADVNAAREERSYQEVWLSSSHEVGGIRRSLRRYTSADSPLQAVFKLREQQFQYSLNPGEVARPVDQRFALLDETSVRVAQEIKFLVENLNVYDPLRTDIQHILGVVENTVTGESSRAFLDINRQLPNFMGQFEQFGLANGRDDRSIWNSWDTVQRGFQKADGALFVRQGDKVFVNPDVPYRTSYTEIWKESVDGRSIRGYISVESPLQQAFELRQQQLDYLLENRENFLVEPTIGNATTARVSQEIQGLLSNLAETDPLRKCLEKVDLSIYAQIGK